MPSWVEADLGTKDFVHFTAKGARVVARMLYNALEDAHDAQDAEDALAEEEGPHAAKTAKIQTEKKPLDG